MNFKKYHESRNVMPAGEQKTVEDNGVTFSSDGNGRYRISGTATTNASVRFNLLSGFTTPISVSNGGQGTLSLFNNQLNNNVTFVFYNGTAYVDGWKTSPINRTNTTYNNIGDKYIDNIVITVNSGETVDMMITPEFTNDGALPSEFEPYSSEVWHDTPHYIHNTSTDTITTLPAVVYPNATTATVGLKGNMSQSGTPTPDNPIQPSETGDKTANLLDTNGSQEGYITDDGSIITSHANLRLTTYIKIPDNTSNLTQSCETGYAMLTPAMCFFNANKEYISGEAFRNATEKTFTVPNNAVYIRTCYRTTSPWNMLNTGSTALPYEPFGVKIPISSGDTTTNNYLGEVQTTRKIKKLVLTGEEEWAAHWSSNSLFTLSTITDYMHARIANLKCSHYVGTITVNGYSEVGNLETALYYNTSSPTMSAFYIRDDNISGATAFKAYLAQQYAAGTPVCVWYVLAEPTTAIVNEPLRKIGDYADTVSNISIPVTAGGDMLSVDTTLQPSEVTVNYKGWHPVADVHERENGAWT